MRKNNPFLWFGARMELTTCAERIWFSLTFFLLIFYTEAVVLLRDVILERFSPPRAILSAAVVLVVCFGGILLLRRIRLAPVSERRLSWKRTALVFLVVFVLTYVYSFLWDLAYWPGASSNDSKTQFLQVVSGQYNDWHPVLQTWLFLGLPYWLFHTPAAIIPMQLIWFSLAMAYLMTVLYNNRCPMWFMILGGLYILANPNTMGIMLHPWKDSAMSIFAMVLFTQLLQIFVTDGAWLKSRCHLAAFLIFAFLTIAMRHNAILLAAPCFVVLFIFFKPIRKQTLLAAAGVIAALLLLHGPIYSLANVVKPDQRVVETMGLPMTILCNVYANDPEALSPETQEFMSSLATPFDWAYYHVPGNFNLIKWNSSKGLTGIVDAAGYGTLFRYTAEALRGSPGYAMTAFGKLTSMVWSIGGADGWRIGISAVEDTSGIADHTSLPLFHAFSAYSASCEAFPFRLLFNYVGGVMLVMLFAAVSSIGGGLKRAFFILPILAHNFGTMLLLSGPDFRFFHCNFVVIVPLLYLFLFKRGLPEHEV